MLRRINDKLSINPDLATHARRTSSPAPDNQARGTNVERLVVSFIGGANVAYDGDDAKAVDAILHGDEGEGKTEGVGKAEDRGTAGE